MSANPSGKPRCAIIGTGIAGLGCAYLLSPYFDLTLFEKNDYLGGHSHTVTVTPSEGLPLDIDTGFMVYNTYTYPNLCRLFDKLKVRGTPTDMSFSVHHHGEDIEWCGSSWNQLFGQRRNLFRPRFWKMLLELDRLCKAAPTHAQDDRLADMSIADYLRAHGFSDDMRDWFLVPMSAAIWSTSPSAMLDFPARTLLRFFVNHRFLRMSGHLQWLTIPGGARFYVEQLMAAISPKVFLNHGAVKVDSQENSVLVTDTSGQHHTFDLAIMACHADEALSLLQSPTTMQGQLLSPFTYQANEAILHTDDGVLPQRRRVWAAWNYRVDPDGNNHFKASTHYWMNRLQHLPTDAKSPIQYVVSINGGDLIEPSKIIKTIAYHHPVFTRPAIAAQAQLPQLNEANDSLFFCGSYFRYGFHEDAFSSAVDLSRLLVQRYAGETLPW